MGLPLFEEREKASSALVNTWAEDLKMDEINRIVIINRFIVEYYVPMGHDANL